MLSIGVLVTLGILLYGILSLCIIGIYGEYD